ncbi:MAG: hypothetical protein ACRC33_32095, partial [Gemmataceae bacterium]
FRPFRVVMTDGQGYDVRHPDMLWIGARTAYVGLTTQIDPDPFWERSVRLDLLHVIRVEPLAAVPPHGTNGAG